MAHPRTLSEHQLEVLRWVADGCPEGVFEDVSVRISVAALRRRGLVETSGRGATWTANVTSDGVRYLELADSENPPKPRQASVSVTQQLVDEIMAAGGSLTVRQLRYGEKGVDYEKRVAAAQRHGKVPSGKLLVVSRLQFPELRIDLIDGPEGTDVELRPVPVPGRVSRYHPAVRTFRDHADTHTISRASLPRALRILQGLVVEAERRGHLVGSEQATLGGGRQRGEEGRGLPVFTVDAYSVAVDVVEEGLPSRGYWEKKNRSYTGYGHAAKLPPRSEYEANATGRLTIELVGHWRSGRQKRWSDRKRWRVEDKLPELLREIEVRAAEHRHNVSENQRLAEVRQRAWEEAMDKARVRYAEQKRIDALFVAVEAWQRSEAIHAYCDALERSGRGGLETVEWARNYADRQSSFRDLPIIPESSTPAGLEELRPFLDGWSPHGPDL